MRLFLMFLLSCFICGMFLDRLERRLQLAIIACLCVLVSIGYYFFNEI